MVARKPGSPSTHSHLTARQSYRCFLPRPSPSLAPKNRRRGVRTRRGEGRLLAAEGASIYRATTNAAAAAGPACLRACLHCLLTPPQELPRGLHQRLFHSFCLGPSRWTLESASCTAAQLPSFSRAEKNSHADYAERRRRCLARRARDSGAD